MLEDTLIFDFNIPIGTEFELLKIDNRCLICENEDVAKESAPFFFSETPTNELVSFMKEKYNLALLPEEIDEHRSHIRPIYDDELRDLAKRDLKLIESDIRSKINEEDVIESNIRSLNARRLVLEKTGEYGREWRDTTQTLHKWVELKLKKEKKIEDAPATKIFFGDLVGGEDVVDQTADSNKPSKQCKKED